MFNQNDTYFDTSPNGLNCLEGFKDHPNETLQMLQIATSYNLTLEPSAIALGSALELADVLKINMLAL